MAGDWIKMRSNLWDDPRVGRIIDLTDSSEGPVIGALYWLWTMADQHTEDGFLSGLTLKQIDRKTGLQGYGAALVEIGWVECREDGIRILRFEEHNGASAKRRCMEAQRKANSRSVSASDADKSRTDDGQDEDEIRRVAELEKEKRREEEIQEANASSSPPMAPTRLPCPHGRVQALYNELLPELPEAKTWGADRERAARQRWSEIAKVKAWKTQDEGIAWFRRFFEEVRADDFLMGRTPPGKGHEGWRCTVDHLLSPSGFRRVFEGHGQRQEADA